MIREHIPSVKARQLESLYTRIFNQTKSRGYKLPQRARTPGKIGFKIVSKTKNNSFTIYKKQDMPELIEHTNRTDGDYHNHSL